MSKFINGKIAEDLVEKILKDIGCETERSEGKFLEWDLRCKLKTKKFTVEVKYDYMSAKTGNLCIETWNTKQDKPSGLSATKAKIWAVCIPDGDHITVWLTKTKDLREFVKNNDPKRTIEKAGDDNTRILLYDDFEILAIFEKIDHLDLEQKARIIRKLIK